MATDSGGNVYIGDYGNSPELKRSTRSSASAELLVTSLSAPDDVAVDSVGDAYVTDLHGSRVLNLLAAA